MIQVLETVFGVLVLVALPVRGWYRSKQRQFFNVPAYLAETILLSLFLLLLLYLNHVQLQTLGLRLSPWPQFMWHCILGATVVIGLDFGTLFVLRANRDREFKVEQEQAFPGDPLPIVVVCMFSAFWEELCFRGVPLYLSGRGFWPPLVAVVLSSLVFALQHLREGITRAAYTGFYGVLFFVIYLATRDLGATMVAHVTGNMFASLYGSREYRKRNQEIYHGFDVSQLP